MKRYFDELVLCNNNTCSQCLFDVFFFFFHQFWHLNILPLNRLPVLFVQILCTCFDCRMKPENVATFVIILSKHWGWYLSHFSFNFCCTFLANISHEFCCFINDSTMLCTENSHWIQFIAKRIVIAKCKAIFSVLSSFLQAFFIILLVENFQETFQSWSKLHAFWMCHSLCYVLESVWTFSIKNSQKIVLNWSVFMCRQNLG